jgi:hypothetical protein
MRCASDASSRARPWRDAGIRDDEGQSGVVERLRALGPVALGIATELFDGAGWSALIAEARRWSQSAIELSALTDADLHSALAFLESNPRPAEYVSLHAPVSVPTDGADRRADLLARASVYVDAIVQHSQVPDNVAPWKRLGRLIVIENMDVNKSDGRDVGELASYFAALPEARFCLDVAHVRTVDATMGLGQELLDSFGDRLAEVHVSGIDEDCEHQPLGRQDVERYSDLLQRCTHVPWMVEALPADLASTTLRLITPTQEASALGRNRGPAGATAGSASGSRSP